MASSEAIEKNLIRHLIFDGWSDAQIIDHLWRFYEIGEKDAIELIQQTKKPDRQPKDQ